MPFTATLFGLRPSLGRWAALISTVSAFSPGTKSYRRLFFSIPYEPRANRASAMLGGMMKARGAAFVVLAVFLVVLTACAPGPNVAAASGPDTAGFWLGLWHGIISPITFIVSLFNHAVSIYEVHNNGGWYNFGFLLGASMVLGGGGAGGARSRRRRSKA